VRAGLGFGLNPEKRKVIAVFNVVDIPDTELYWENTVTL
jgi:hypothetical protein